MNTNNDNNLKPGDRVLLTGFNNTTSQIIRQNEASKIGHCFTLDIDVFYGGLSKLHVNGVALHCFTYEKIETDGNK